MSDNINERHVVIPKRILNSILTSLSSGVVPRTGAPYIAIGRQKEIEALLSDLSVVSEGGSSMRFIIGRYGSGKSFLVQLLRGYATDVGFVCMDADLSPERRLYGSGGSGVATYRELIANMSTKTSPDGGALHTLAQKQLSRARDAVLADGVSASDEEYAKAVTEALRYQLRELRMSVGGFDFCEVLAHYFSCMLNDDDAGCASCMRWLRGEFSTKSEAKRALGFSVSCIPDDDNWYDFIKLWAVYVRICGYKGLVVMLDECVNLYKITNRVSRENNYEKILSMFNDALSARAEGLMMLFCGTPQFLEDGRRGLFGYEALRSRLCDSRFADEKTTSVNGPVIRLRRLSDDEMFALLLRVRGLYSRLYSDARVPSDEECAEFYRVCSMRAGAGELMTPREMIRDFLFVLDALRENRDTSLSDIISRVAKIPTDRSEEDDDGHGIELRPRHRNVPAPEDIEI